jgi:pimeloyl-ACP methyl ester carboxylesterase
MSPNSHLRARLAAAIVSLVALTTAGAACGDDSTTTTTTTTKETTMSPTDTATSNGGDADHTDPADVRRELVDAGGTTLAAQIRGDGPPLLLIHGGGEDAGMYLAQAESLVAAGFQVVTYDRRGTGGSGREDWPGNGADQHADDAAALLDALDLTPAVVVGMSSGGVVALDVAARHPEHVTRVIAWEPPVAGLLPGAEQINAEILAPVNAHLAEHPGDFVGAQAVLLSFIIGVPVTVDDPAFAATRANAEPMIRDDPTITLQTFGPADFAGVDVSVAVGSAPNELIAAATDRLAVLLGKPTVRVEGEHQVYLFDPSVITGIVASEAPPS